MLKRIDTPAERMWTSPGRFTLVEIEEEHAIYLITQPGHVAPPSIMRRSLFMADGVRMVRVEGFSAAPAEARPRTMNRSKVQAVVGFGRRDTR